LSDEEVEEKPDIITSKPETITDKMEIDFTTDPWINKRVFKLFLPSENEHPSRCHCMMH
jgi:hypothetical protein